MFPISWDKMFRTKAGSLVKMDDAMSGGGGGGGSLPPHSAADAGKVLGVTNDGSLAWVTVSASATSYKAHSNTGSDVNVVISAGEVI